ncbi:MULTISPECIES: hypothetical protein [Streptomyces violaceusniger group]|uniref:Uncharacterized protein n=2 Tax=Streptomyces rhizosphaericus TaxID=114699 RepID=A0ABP4BUV8_9ACTN|nr:hypothetical protein [Streptomyces asiaticus]
MTKLADRGWLYKRPDGKFTVRLQQRHNGGGKGRNRRVPDGS